MNEEVALAVWMHTALVGALFFGAGALCRGLRRPSVAAVAAPAPALRSAPDDLERARAEAESLREALAGAHAFVAAAPDPKLVEALRVELGAAARREEALRGDAAERARRLALLEAEGRRLLADNARLARELGALPGLRRELERLREDNGRLRAEAALGRRAQAPVAVPSGGHELQALVERICREDALESAVVTDELGLVVACSGHHGEELAAVGAALARSGAQLRQLLPLSRLERLTLEDELHHAVTIRPLDSAEAELALVTFGPAPGEGPHAPSSPGTSAPKGEMTS